MVASVGHKTDATKASANNLKNATPGTQSWLTPDRAIFAADLSAAVLSTIDFAYTVGSCVNPLFAVPCILNTAMKVAEVSFDTSIHLADTVISRNSPKTWRNWMGAAHLTRFSWAAYSALTGTGAVTEVSEKVGSPFNINWLDLPFHGWGMIKHWGLPASNEKTA